jgi:hypothetical protein
VPGTGEAADRGAFADADLLSIEQSKSGATYLVVVTALCRWGTCCIGVRAALAGSRASQYKKARSPFGCGQSPNLYGGGGDKRERASLQ